MFDQYQWRAPMFTYFLCVCRANSSLGHGPIHYIPVLTLDFLLIHATHYSFKSSSYDKSHEKLGTTGKERQH